MSGKRQHTIPRFVIKGFASPSGDRNRFICRVFRRDAEPYKANIINVGVQGHFYSHNSIPDVDSNITRMESNFAKLFNQIKHGKQSALSNPLLPKMLVHFELRTRCLRDTLLHTTGILLNKCIEYLSKESNRKAWMKQFMRSNSEALRNMIAAELRASGWPSELVEPMRMLIHRFGPGAIDQRATTETFVRWESGLDEFIRERIKLRHLQSLDNPATQEEEAEKYAKLSYAILPTTELPMILGDSIVLFRVSGQPCYKNHLTSSDDLTAIYLPLNSNNVLVGALQKPRVLPYNLREEIARCSREFFVAAEITDSLRALQPCIGTDANMVSDGEVKQRVDNLLFGENATLSVNFSPVSRYELGATPPGENQKFPPLVLVLLSQWGYQGFTLNLDTAESLGRNLARLVKQ